MGWIFKFIFIFCIASKWQLKHDYDQTIEICHNIYSQLQFSTSVELESQNVCLMYVCLYVCPRTLGQRRKRNNWSTELKFGTRIPYGNTQGCFFYFFKFPFFSRVIPILPGFCAYLKRHLTKKLTSNIFKTPQIDFFHYFFFANNWRQIFFQKWRTQTVFFANLEISFQSSYHAGCSFVYSSICLRHWAVSNPAIVPIYLGLQLSLSFRHVGLSTKLHNLALPPLPHPE